jgi:putative redox protein
VEITWINEHRFLAVDSSNHSVMLSPPNDIGMKPSEMLLVSLASCSAYDVINILQKQRAVLGKMAISVKSEQASEPPWRYQHIHLHFTVTGSNLTKEQFEKAVNLSMNNYCSVRATIASDVAVTFDVDLQQDNAES